METLEHVPLERGEMRQVLLALLDRKAQVIEILRRTPGDDLLWDLRRDLEDIRCAIITLEQMGVKP